MKQFLTITFFLICYSVFSQETTLDVIKEDAKITIHAMKFSVNSAEELQTINWKEIKDSFNDNNPEELIELAFEIDLPESKNKFKSSFKVGGRTKDIDALIKKMKKGVKKIVKISSNYK